MWRRSIDEEWHDALDNDALKARSVRGGLVTAIVQLVRVGLMLGSQILLARLLLPEDFGMVAMVAPVIGFVQVIADLGITQAIVSAERLTLRQINAFFWLNLLLTLSLAIVAAACAPLVAWFYGEPRLIAIVLACAALILVSGASLVQAALLNRRMMFGTIAGIDVAALLISVMTGVVMAATGWSYWSLVGAQGAFSVSMMVFTMVCAPWHPHRPEWDAGALALMRFGGAVTAANVISYVNVSVDNVIIGAQLGKVALGFYDRAWKLAVQPITQIQAPFNRVAIPALSRLIANPPTYRNAFLRMLQIMLLMSTPTMICAALVAGPLVELLLGARWLPIVPLVAWMFFSGVATPVNSAVFWLLVTQGRVREQIRLSAAVAAVNISAYAIGVQYGLVGLVALSVISVFVVQTPLLVGVAVRRGPVRFGDIAPLLGVNMVAAIATAAAVLAVRHVLAGPAVLLVAPIVAMLANGVTLLAFAPSRHHLLAGRSLAVAALRRSVPEQPPLSDAI